MNSWNSTLRRSSPLKRTKALAHKAALKAGKKRLRSKQRPVTAEEKALWDRMAALGCIACRIDGHINTYVSIHHLDGRTKPGCHKKVLPLCAPHHQQDDTDPMGRIAVHPNKAAFEHKYGRQEDLLDEVMGLLGE